MKKYTEKTAAALVNALLKSMRKTPRDALHNVWTDEQGRTCALDGYRAYCLNKEPRGLREEWTCKPDFAAAAARRAENNRILSHVFKALDAGDVVEMPAPDPDAVKSFISTAKAAGKEMIYDLGPEYPAVNAKYLYDLCRLFPVAKWYVDMDPRARMVRPVYVVASEGRAVVMPVRVQGKTAAAQAPEKPAERPENNPPAPAPAADEKPLKYDYCIYSRPAGEKRFLLTDLNSGSVGVNKLFAPRYKRQDLEKIMEMLDSVSEENPGAAFQLRKLDGKTVVYTAATLTPETFAKMIV